MRQAYRASAQKEINAVNKETSQFRRVWGISVSQVVVMNPPLCRHVVKKHHNLQKEIRRNYRLVFDNQDPSRRSGGNKTTTPR